MINNKKIGENLFFEDLGQLTKLFFLKKPIVEQPAS